MSDLFGEDRSHSTGTGQLDAWMHGGSAAWKERVGPDLLGGYATLVYLQPRQQDNDNNNDQDDHQEFHLLHLPERGPT